MDALDRLVKETPYLLIDSSGARLARTLPRGDLLLGMDIAGALARFRPLIGQRTVFTASDLQTISARNYGTVNRWRADSLIQCVGIDSDTRERLFDVTGAFTAGILGSLARHRMSRKTLRAVASALRAALAAEVPA